MISLELSMISSGEFEVHGNQWNLCDFSMGFNLTNQKCDFIGITQDTLKKLWRILGQQT